MHRSTLLLAALLSCSLTGCVGMVAKAGAERLFGDKEKTADERARKAQESAIAGALGGSAGTPIAWSDATSGIKGTLMPDSVGDAPGKCRHYQETIILAGETLQGPVTACAQQDGTWKLDGAVTEAKN